MNIIRVYKQFPKATDCLKHLEKVRWNGKPTCHYCKSVRSTPLSKEMRYHCNACNTSYSVTVGTIFHKTKIDLQKWFLAISLVLNAKKGLSARQLASDLEVNKNTAWFMLMRIRKAMIEYGDLLTGIVEADETYIGGKSKNKHNNKRPKGGQGRNTDEKMPVFGPLERNGNVRVSGKTLKKIIGQLVKKGSTLMTDEWKSYNGLAPKFAHSVVNHSSGQYVQGKAHTNTLERFWSLLKRGIIGQYHQVSRKHLDCYVNEFCFRYNYRDDENVFEIVLGRCVA